MSRIRSVLFAIAALSLLAGHAFAQEAAEETEPTETVVRPENALLADLSLGVVGVSYERVLANAFALNIGLQLYVPWYESPNVYGVGGEVRGFLFPEARAPEGFYASVGVRAAYVGHESEQGLRDGYAWSVRIAIGYSILADAFLLRLGLGGQYQVLDTTEQSGVASDDFDNVAPVVDIFLGGAF